MLANQSYSSDHVLMGRVFSVLLCYLRLFGAVPHRYYCKRTELLSGFLSLSAVSLSSSLRKLASIRRIW